MPSENIIHLFINAANKHPHQPAFIEGKTKITYGKLLQQVQLTANYFFKKGIDKDSKVLVFVPMKIKLYVTVLSLLYIGACPVFLDEWVSVSRLKECLKTVPCTAIIAERKLLFLSWFIKPLRRLVKIYVSNQTSLFKLIVPVETNPDDTALVTFTTGTTGTPKAANRTHQFLKAQCNALQPLLLNELQTTLTLLPVVVLLNVSLGKTNVLPQRKLSVRKLSSVGYILQLIKKYDVASIIASPAITVAIAKQLMQHNTSNTIRQIITGGGPVFPDDAQYIISAFPQAVVMGVYGSTEAEPISIIDMNDLANTTALTMQLKGLPVGGLHTDIQVAIIPFTTERVPNQSLEDWQHRKLQYGCSGEIVVSGPHVLKSYLNNGTAQRQNKFFVDNVLWHRTGDEGMMDESNNLYFRGRCTEVIYFNKHNIYPLINTWILKQKVPIHEAAIMLVNDQFALILAEQDRGLQEQIIAALKGTALENASIRYLPSMPKDKRHNTKIDYEKLRQLLY